MSFKLYSTLLVLLLAAFTQAALIEPLTRTPLRPYSINQDYSTEYSFSVYIPSAIASNAIIEVEFPLPYQIPSACRAFIKFEDDPFAMFPCEKPSHSRYIVKIEKIIPGDYQIVFENIQNPLSYPASSTFKIRTYLNRDVLVDANEYFDAVPFLPTPSKSFLKKFI